VKRAWTTLFVFDLFSRNGIEEMKRIALLVCGLVLVCASSAEARWRRRSNRSSTPTTYYRPVAATPATQDSAQASYTAPAADDSQAVDNAIDADEAEGASSAEAKSTAATLAATVSYSTRTAQGVANLMAANNRVAHVGGNPGYEGCGCGATPAAAYAVCCYGNSGMATVDVGYARGSNGTWYCCRRYR
jgi:hypothetical protein